MQKLEEIDANTAVVEICFPKDSPLSREPIDENQDNPFSESYLRAIGIEDVEPQMREWKHGITLVWESTREYVEQRVEELAAYGWKLAEPFEDYAEDGFLGDPESRFTFKDADNGAVGSVFGGVTFRMERIDSDANNAAAAERKRAGTIDFDVTRTPIQRLSTYPCPSCGHPNHRYSLSCEKCGDRLEVRDVEQAAAADSALTDDGTVIVGPSKTETPPPGLLPETKACPFCAEEIKYQAIKCRYCGEILDQKAAFASGSQKVAYETKLFIIPFPTGSPPTEHILKYGDDPFPGEFHRSMGWKSRYGWSNGVTKLWDHYKDYFLERINELGREGWDLAEPFEQPRDEFGQLVRCNDRFNAEGTVVAGIFGNVERFRLTGARFIMRRAIYG